MKNNSKATYSLAMYTPNKAPSKLNLLKQNSTSNNAICKPFQALYSTSIRQNLGTSIILPPPLYYQDNHNNHIPENQILHTPILLHNSDIVLTFLHS
ncbi:MAG: hypothetical protein V1904_06230 [Bacteroidota bacterium]